MRPASTGVWAGQLLGAIAIKNIGAVVSSLRVRRVRENTIPNQTETLTLALALTRATTYIATRTRTLTLGFLCDAACAAGPHSLHLCARRYRNPNTVSRPRNPTPNPNFSTLTLALALIPTLTLTTVTAQGSIQLEPHVNHFKAPHECGFVALSHNWEEYRVCKSPPTP